MQGYSGGPLAAQWPHLPNRGYSLVGIVSTGPRPCGKQGKFDVFTRFTSYIDWVAKKYHFDVAETLKP
jgi:secreted trypsin-like serine protease